MNIMKRICPLVLLLSLSAQAQADCSIHRITDGDLNGDSSMNTPESKQSLTVVETRGPILSYVDRSDCGSALIGGLTRGDYDNSRVLTADSNDALYVESGGITKASDTLEIPSAPNKPDTSDALEIPTAPAPNEPNASDAPEIPTAPAPNEPDTADAPGIPTEPGEPDTPSVPGKSDTIPLPNLPTDFIDVPNGAYYVDAVKWAVAQGITNGTSATTFSPAATSTRGQVATFLWRAKGSPEPSTNVNPFTDVSKDSAFYKAILWAYENQITTGTSATTFSPGDPCTRAHVTTFLWRAEGQPLIISTASTLADDFPKGYYTDAVAWAESKDILSGTDAPFTPTAPCPRADIVTYLYRDLVH